MKVKIILIIVATIVGVLILLEVSLRLLLGLGNPPLYIADQDIGYLLAPQQQTRRFGNRILINEYSMRSANISQNRPSSTFRLFLLGDSVANGAWWTDQEKTISALMEQYLSRNLPQNSQFSQYSQVEVLNASANSWGPRNELAYLRRFGIFQSQVLILLLNTDDLFATAPTSLPVGRDYNYPDHKPLLALTEAYTRLFIRPKPIAEMVQVNAEKGDRVGFNLNAIAEIQAIATQNHSQLLLAITPLKREIGQPGPKDYEQKARQRLQEFTQQQNIVYIDFLSKFNQVKKTETLYRDHIHLSTEGNQLVSDTITQSLLNK
jgi:GDSL-like Lipase/Acylhydrolase family